MLFRNHSFWQHGKAACWRLSKKEGKKWNSLGATEYNNIGCVSFCYLLLFIHPFSSCIFMCFNSISCNFDGPSFSCPALPVACLQQRLCMNVAGWKYTTAVKKITFSPANLSSNKSQIRVVIVSTVYVPLSPLSHSNCSWIKAQQSLLALSVDTNTGETSSV